jgi:hypothetical protein
MRRLSTSDPTTAGANANENANTNATAAVDCSLSATEQHTPDYATQPMFWVNVDSSNGNHGANSEWLQARWADADLAGSNSNSSSNSSSSDDSRIDHVHGMNMSHLVRATLLLFGTPSGAGSVFNVSDGWQGWNESVLSCARIEALKTLGAVTHSTSTGSNDNNGTDAAGGAVFGETIASQQHQGEKWHSIGVTAAIARQKHVGAANNYHSLNVNVAAGSPEQEAAFWSSREGQDPPCLILEFA